MWKQHEFKLTARRRGFTIITNEITKQLIGLEKIQCGILHLFIKHSSASLTINENADPTVRTDMEKHFNVMAPERASYYQHIYEGDDDMPAHIKSALTQTSLSIPIENFEITLGTWQGIYLFEHRKSSHTRIIKIHLIS